MTTASDTVPSSINIGINGFGRIGRLVLRSVMEVHPNVHVKLINNPSTKPEYAAYLFKYDSTHGKYRGTVEYTDDSLIVDNINIPLSHFRNPEDIPWNHYGVDYVIDSTGIFKEIDTASRHTKIKKVLITAPSKTAPMYVFGVNHEKYDPIKDKIISNASCTTNCLAPLIKVLDAEFGIEDALMTTVHSTTASQRTVDGSTTSKDWRGGRSCQGNIIPSSTGAARAVGKVLPQLQGKITGMSIRVPTVNISLVDLTIRTKKDTSYEEIIKTLENYSNGKLKGILGVTHDLVVSSDFISDSRSSIVDARAGIELNSRFFKIISWYDNEFGYASRVVDLIEYVAQRDRQQHA
ncbi:probable Glyceraldehyde-3-phosphate dehydrogenase 2 [Saccharomycodes ludwigii]|uniref:Glyceraldehyde-3-phosphate dehydrogenase n=1 Tax=Saccharomycodes ludwigii TaxID=36035 RepID=A0A376B1U6_9ASCO|nr:hypothetical protein SCDLUD_001394 [Saccharomycodes ludwigii]KAH3901628.1 hypothetical protein SCDLUD_001394 [Saccharomycodes ludwigii]SSD58444.1 probable Glyceraldehyde-3-phosphate dehydrogenase 2 [Saccharomycodes ludwigii]